MKPEMTNKHTQISDSLRRLPRKILQLYGHDNVTHFVLHELCGENCFDMSKAAYFIDNPAFNILKGIAGFSAEESKKLSNSTNIWDNPHHFNDIISQSLFNKKVRSFDYESRKKNGHSHEAMAETIAKDLDIKEYDFYTWDMKHENHGLLVCEKNNSHNLQYPNDEIIVDGLCLLGFCFVPSIIR